MKSWFKLALAAAVALVATTPASAKVVIDVHPKPHWWVTNEVSSLRQSLEQWLPVPSQNLRPPTFPQPTIYPSSRTTIINGQTGAVTSCIRNGNIIICQ